MPVHSTAALVHRRLDGLPEGTRTAILEAAIAVIAKHSLSGTTVQLVADAAGVAAGTVMLHFARKEALLTAALEHVALEFEQARRRALAAAGDDPVAALQALIDVSFDPKVSDPAKVAVWYAFWGEARARRVYMERVGSLDHAYQAGLVRLCEELIARGGYAHLHAEAVAIGFAGVLEWQWQEILLNGRRFDRTRARHVARAYLAGVFPREFAGIQS
jgi:TetR/AcrR family transcriptional repressor of bet genes